MSKNINSTIVLKILGFGIVIVQLLDIIIHAATNQLEIIRVSSNVILLVWSAIVASNRFNTKFLLTAISSISLYLILNMIFLAREGLTNTEQAGGLRTTLFLLMFLSIALSTGLTWQYTKRTLNREQ